MKKAFGIIALSIFFIGCTMNPSKEARIQKLEREIQQSLEKIDQLESKVAALQSVNETLKTKISTIENR